MIKNDFPFRGAGLFIAFTYRYFDYVILNRLETGNALGFENLHGIGLKLIVAGKAGIQADHPFGFQGSHSADQLPSLIPVPGKSAARRRPR